MMLALWTGCHQLPAVVASVLKGEAHNALAARYRYGLDGDSGVIPDGLPGDSGQVIDDLGSLRRALFKLDSGVQVLRVFPDHNDVNVCVARAHAGEALGGAQIGV